MWNKKLVVGVGVCHLGLVSQWQFASSFSLLQQHTTRPFLSSSGRLFSSSTESETTTSSTTDDTPVVLPEFTSREDYLTYMESVSALPKGFATGTAATTFCPVEAPLMGELPITCTVIALEEPTDNWAAVFTRNKFPGSPVLVGKSRLENGGPLQAIVINNKVSNVCSGGDGVMDAEHVCHAVADSLGIHPASVLPSSTGVIGWRLPSKELANVVPQAVAELQQTSTSALNAAQAIMTTDRFPKVRSKTLSSSSSSKNNKARIVGIAKGAGMIEPNMATMLCYIMTDATIPKLELQQMLGEAVNESFNSMSIDGDESTSDTVALVASNQVDGVDLDEFKSALNQVCQGLASDIVRNGEGTGHVMRVVIDNFPGSNEDARRLGRHVVNSPLFKCAVSGNDPNTGRLAGAIGSWMGKFCATEDTSQLSLKLGGRVIFNQNQFVLEGNDVEQELSNHMKNAQLDEHGTFPQHQRFVEIEIDFKVGQASSATTVLGSDLTNEYVAVNADYRS